MAKAQVQQLNEFRVQIIVYLLDRPSTVFGTLGTSRSTSAGARRCNEKQ
jgi:hypothetical protein